MCRVKIKNLLFMAVAIWIFVATNAFLGPIDLSNTANAAGPDYAKVAQAESLPLKPPELQQEEVYRYQYYPASEVYLDPERRLYFYEIDGHLMKSLDLPANLRRPGDFIIVEMKTANPFEFDSQVKQIDLVETERLASESPSSPSWMPVGSEPVYEYRYYPAAAVYLDMNRKIYFYQAKGSWIESPTLPTDIANKLGPSAVLHMNSATPYVYQLEVAPRFPHPVGKVERSVYMIWKHDFAAR